VDTIEEIKKLKSLLDQGAISEEEFNLLKKKVLSKAIVSEEPQKTDLSSPAQNGMVSDPVNYQKTVNKETKKESSNIKKPLKNVEKTKEFQAGNEWTRHLLKIGWGLSLVLGIIFWYRYDSFIAFLITIIISITLTFLVARIIPKLRKRNSTLLIQSVILFLLIIIPIGTIDNMKETDNSSSNKSEQIDDDDKYVRDFIISHYFEDYESGVSFTLEFSDSRGGWFGVMTMKMGECWFLYQYEIKGRSINLTFDSSNCTSQGSSTTAHFNSDNSISLYYRGEEFVFKPI
jgi:hypothetical protein